MSTKVGKYRSIVHRYLSEYPNFRERKNKDAGLAKIIVREFHPELKDHVAAIMDVIQKYGTMDRDWRWTLEHEPTLRGTDYGEKAGLGEDAQLKLGYPAKP